MRFISSAHTVSQSFAVLFVAFFAYAFLYLPTAFAISSANISVDVNPQNPSPHENTTLTLSTYSGDLNSILITWYVNGVKSFSGIGKKSFSVDSGATGTNTRIDAHMAFPDGEVVSSISIHPATMVLLAEANDSYVPPFYKGRALISKGSEVKIVAMPEIKSGASMVNAKNMTYDWKQNYDNAPGASGYSKNYFIYTDDYLENTTNVSVVASTLDQNSSSEASVSPTTTDPKIVFYRLDGAAGIDWDHSVEEGSIVNNVETIFAAPYFISPAEIRTPSLNFIWHINDTMVPTGNYAQNIMPLRVQDGTSGSASLQLDIDNSDKIFQTASKQINLQF